MSGGLVAHQFNGTVLPLALGWGEGGEQNAPLGRAVIGGLITSTFLSLLVIPVVLRTTENMLNLIPGGMREASLALSATKLETTLRVVLPAVMPSILTGLILATEMTGNTNQLPPMLGACAIAMLVAAGVAVGIDDCAHLISCPTS